MSLLDPDPWPERERHWRRALGRIKLGVEPVPDQLERLRLVTWTMTGVAGGIGLMFVALFSAFRHPIIGLIVAGVIVGPVILFSWVGFLRLERRVRLYLKEKADAERAKTISSPGPSS